MNKRNKRKLPLFLLFSLLFHALLILFIATKPAEREAEKLAPLDVEILQPKQIADIQKPKEQKRPQKAKFIGQYDSTVKEERVAVTPPKKGTPRPQRAIERPKQVEKPEKKPDKLAALFAKKKEQAQKKSSGNRKAAKRFGELPQDFYPDYKIGPHTYLNVLRFPDVQYFVRLKRIFKLTFNPVPVLRQYVYANQVSRGHVEVVLGVVVAPSGRLARLFVIRGSGFGKYDQEALRTVRDSSPFTKPPAKLLGPDGQLRMSWTFTVYL